MGLYVTSVTPVSLNTYKCLFVRENSRKDVSAVQNSNLDFDSYSHFLSLQNKAFISFKGYDGDKHPLKKLFGKCTLRSEIYEDEWTKEHLYQAGNKKWVNAYPNELLKRSVEQTIQSICTLTKGEGYPRIKDYIPTPRVGHDPDKWGRYANYIEINPRIVAKYENGTVSEGLLGVMKLLPAIPPSSDKFANCIILSQLYPSFNNDGNIANDGLYCVRLHDEQSTISRNLVCPGLKGKMGDDEQFAAFNQAAHLLGLKTGIRLPLCSNLLMVKNEQFDWGKHKRAYIEACKWAIELGFDCIYFDSAKHVVKKDGYNPAYGELPSFKDMQDITASIRFETGRNDIAFIGEKCDDDYRFKEMGMTAGTDWGKADSFEHVRHESNKQRRPWNSEYAAGPEVSNDNDDGSIKYEQRLNRLKSCLFGYDDVRNKLPSYMQIHDLFPLSPFTNTHELMKHTHQTSAGDGTECERHFDGCFSTAAHAREYTQKVYNEFKYAMFV